MSNQFQKGHVFVPGEVVDPDDLNNLVDLATSLEGIVSSQPVESPPANSSEVLVRTVAGLLRRRQVSTLPTGVTSVGLTVTPTSVFQVTGTPVTGAGTLGVVTRDQLPNKLFAGPNSGTGTGPVGFRTLVPADVSVPTSPITASLIDWSLSNTFDKTLTSPATTFTFSNVDDGQTILVRLRQDATGGRTVGWNPAPLGPINWLGGVTPIADPAHNSYSIFVFTAVNDVAAGALRVHGYMETTTAGAVSNVSATATPASVFGITVTNPSSTPAIALSLDTQAQNTFLAGPVTGADAVPTFRPIAPADTSLYVNVPAHIIDCTLGNSFQKILHGVSDTLHINNGIPGQRIKVFLQQGDTGGPTTLTWTTDDASGVLRWPGGVDHTMTTGQIANVDIVDFFCTGGGQYWGTFNKNFSP